MSLFSAYPKKQDLATERLFPCCRCEEWTRRLEPALAQAGSLCHQSLHRLPGNLETTGFMPETKNGKVWRPGKCFE